MTNTHRLNITTFKLKLHGSNVSDIATDKALFLDQPPVLECLSCR